jgi:hypothetical protein
VIQIDPTDEVQGAVVAQPVAAPVVEMAAEIDAVMQEWATDSFFMDFAEAAAESVAAPPIAPIASADASSKGQSASIALMSAAAVAGIVLNSKTSKDESDEV